MWYKTNMDEKHRDEIIFGKHEPEKYVGGIRRFNGLTLDKLLELAAWEFIDMTEQHNSCPCAETILRFMEKYPGYAATGYAVSAKRDDYRVSLDGLEKNGRMTEGEMDEARILFDKADKLKITENGMECWFD